MSLSALIFIDTDNELWAGDGVGDGEDGSAPSSFLLRRCRRRLKMTSYANRGDTEIKINCTHTRHTQRHTHTHTLSTHTQLSEQDKDKVMAWFEALAEADAVRKECKSERLMAKLLAMFVLVKSGQDFSQQSLRTEQLQQRPET